MKKNSLISLFIFFNLLFVFSCTKKNKPVVENKTIKTDTLKTIERISKQDFNLVFVDPIDVLIDSLLENKKKKSVKLSKDKDFEKGIYLTAYSVAGKSFPELLSNAKNSGINTIVFDVKNMDGTIFDKKAQKSTYKQFSFRNTLDIRKVTEVIHDADMKAVSRIVMFHDINIAKKDSTLCPFRFDGSHWIESKRKGPAWLDPSNHKVQSILLTLIDWTARQGVEEIQLDYVRFPTQGDVGNAIFAYQKEDSLFAEKDSLYKFRSKDDIIASFVKKASAICHSHNVRLSADVFAITSWQRKSDISATGQNLKKMSLYLDEIHPMIYSSHFDKHFDFRKNYWNDGYLSVYEGSVRTMVNSNKNCKVIPYIQGNSWRVRFNKEYIYSQIAAVKDSGSKGYIFWNASNRYSKIFDWIKEKPVDRL